MSEIANPATVWEIMEAVKKAKRCIHLREDGVFICNKKSERTLRELFALFPDTKYATKERIDRTAYER